MKTNKYTIKTFLNCMSSQMILYTVKIGLFTRLLFCIFSDMVASNNKHPCCDLTVYLGNNNSTFNHFLSAKPLLTKLDDIRQFYEQKFSVYACAWWSRVEDKYFLICIFFSLLYYLVFPRREIVFHNHKDGFIKLFSKYTFAKKKKKIGYVIFVFKKG